MSNVTKPIALDESINTTENTPRNIADVLADELSNIADKIQGGGSGGSGGHIIQNASGANLTQRNTMQFTDSHVSDDSTNEKTVIENIKSVTEAQFESATEDGLYDVDVEGAEIGEISEDYVEITADGVKTWKTLLNELRAEIDLTKVTIYSVLTYNGDIYSALYIDNNTLAFSSSGNVSSVSGGVPATVEMLIRSSSSQCFVISGTTVTDVSSNKPTNGTKITLYYGNDKAVVDLQTTANRCLMSSGNSVENALTYSTTEHAVGKWIDGSVLYEKTYNFGTLPNTTYKSVAHNISNLKRIISMSGYAYGSNGNTLPIPYSSESSTGANISLYCDDTYINITTGSNRSAFTESYITLRYTKTV